MRFLLVTLLFAFAGRATAQQSSKHLAPKPDPQQALLLAQAFRSNSADLLGKFCDTWAMQTPPYTTEEIDRLPDSIREIYRVYAEFYDPGNPAPTVGSDLSGQLYSDMHYCVIQDEMPYAFVDTLFQDSTMEKEFQRVASDLGISMDSVKRGFSNDRTIQDYLNIHWHRPDSGHLLKNFRPPILLPNRQILILTPEYQKLLEQFQALHGARTMVFLSTRLTITDFHGRDLWPLFTKPVILSIILDRSFNKAMVNFFLARWGGDAYYKKVNGKWTLMGSQMTIYD